MPLEVETAFQTEHAHPFVTRPRYSHPGIARPAFWSRQSNYTCDVSGSKEIIHSESAYIFLKLSLSLYNAESTTTTRLIALVSRLGSDLFENTNLTYVAYSACRASQSSWGSDLGTILWYDSTYFLPHSLAIGRI